jgi:hypothetical protein
LALSQHNHLTVAVLGVADLVFDLSACAQRHRQHITVSNPNDNGEHPHLVNSDQMCSTLRSNAIKIFVVIGNDGQKIT